MSRQPFIPGDPATVRISIRVTPSVKSDLEQVARDNLTTSAGVIREAVNEYVFDYRNRPVFVLRPNSCQ